MSDTPDEADVLLWIVALLALLIEAGALWPALVPTP